MMLMPVYVPASAETEVFAAQIPVVVKENNGIYVSASLYRRGFALPEGRFFSLDDFGVYTTDGKGVPSSFEITEKYKDGSVKWALCSFVTDLRASERKELVIKNTGATPPESPVSVAKSLTGYNVSNKDLKATLTKNGIGSVTYKGVGFTDNIATYITENGQSRSELTVEEISVLAQTPLYARIMIKGSLGDIASTELVVTVASGVDHAEIESRVIGLKQMNVFSMGIKMISNGTVFSYPDSPYNSENQSGADYIYSTKDGVTGYFVTADNEKFRGATGVATTTGFLFDSPAIYVAPLIGSKSYLWHDGLTRTNHLYICFEKSSVDYGTNLKNPPAVEIDPKSFEEAGVIALAGSCAPIDRVINLAYHDLNNRNGKIDAGAITYGNDPDTNSFSSTDAHPGEMEHNYGIAYMATGDPVLFRVMNESAEFWADVEVYKGSHEDVYGANRYRTAASYTGDRFKTTHPYYGDSSGLYMSYVLTGNEYYRDCYKAAVEHMYSNMFKTSGKNCGFNYPHMKNWISGTPVTTTYSESRYMIQARPLYYAYGLFGDEKFREAALEITRWAAHTQDEDGWWYQAYHDDGRPFRQGGQNQDAVKTYIWMYGLRGISFLSRYEDTPEIRLVLSRAGKFVENEYKNFGKGLWKPTGDPNLYMCDEDNTRGKGPYEDIMALELLYQTYRLTGDESYFKSLLDCTETWLSSMNPGGGTILLANMEGKGTNTVVGGGQNYTLLQIFPELRELFKEKADRIRELGYDYLLTVFDDNAKMYDGNIVKVNVKEPEVTQIVFENGEDKVLFGTNFTGTISGSYTKDYETIIPEGRLWLGAENRISIPGKVTLYQHMKQFDRILARQIPVSVTSLSDKISVFVDQYNQDKIVMRVYGDGIVKFNVEDGIFSIVKDKRYSVTAKRDGANGAVITVCRNCINNLSVASDSLKFKVTLNANTYIKDTDSISAYTVAKAGLMSLENNNFEPDSEADAKEFSDAVATLTGTDEVFEGITCNDAASFVLDVADKVNPTFFENSGIVKKSVTAVGNNISDEEAVKEAASVLELSSLLSKGASLELAETSVAGTTVHWSSDNNAVQISNGILTVAEETADIVKVTATVCKGEAKLDKVFELKIKSSSEVKWYSNTMTISENKYNLNTLTGNFTINFDVTPKTSVTNAIVGFVSSESLVNAFSDLPIIFRFSPDGNIDAYNGSSYAFTERLKYEGGVKYKVRMNVYLKDKKYDVYVTPEGGREYVIAKDFAFRATAPDVAVIDTVYIPTATAGSELFCISYMDCASPAQPGELDKLEMYDENGLMFGKYAEDKIYLPEYEDNEKISWISTNYDVINEYGKVVLEHGVKDAALYGLKGVSAATPVDILKKLGLIETSENADSKLTRVQAAELINAMRYIMTDK